jgi:DNA-binding XRE family transcriptional regulator
MEIIKGGDNPKYGIEARAASFKRIIDWHNINLPLYNPRQFKLCRNLDGLTKWEFAKRAGLSTKKYSDIEAGNINPTTIEFEAIVKSQDHCLPGFFQQWPESEPDFSLPVAMPIAIDYYKYKVFRDINKPKEMKAIPLNFPR